VPESPEEAWGISTFIFDCSAAGEATMKIMRTTRIISTKGTMLMSEIVS
jgi:hypothetical protein